MEVCQVILNAISSTYFMCFCRANKRIQTLTIVLLNVCQPVLYGVDLLHHALRRLEQLLQDLWASSAPLGAPARAHSCLA